MTIKTEGVHAGEVLLSEANGTRSREDITLAATAALLPAGQLLGTVTASGHYGPYDPDALDGTNAVTAVLYAPVGISASPQRSVGIVRDAEVKRALLTGLDTAGEADLLALGILAR
ncbi:head decoration protein [Azotobacter chroococcum]|uniref:head decoration protein n=1 Tax=Azotobacter chroococcum TaxID=353 RepID=UPI000B5DDC22|nr:head decoration protein [Azotobacter chroococcum]ASL27358.1 hypothetical protein ACG10_14525 [Azotobacter chroococcum]